MRIYVEGLDRDDAEPTPLFSPLSICQFFNIELMDVNSASIFSIFSRTRIGGMAVGWGWALPHKNALVHTSCICYLVIAKHDDVQGDGDHTSLVGECDARPMPWLTRRGGRPSHCPSRLPFAAHLPPAALSRRRLRRAGSPTIGSSAPPSPSQMYWRCCFSF